MRKGNDGQSIYILISLLLISLSILPYTENSVALNDFNRQNIIYVDCGNVDGPWDGSIDHPYRHIQDAIDAADETDTIYVFEGIYNESVIIEKSVTLIGENRDRTIIDASKDGTVILIEASNVVVKNFTIRNSGGYAGDAGVKISSDNVKIVNCTIYRTRSGIFLANSAGAVIGRCNFSINGKAIVIENSTEIAINGCYFEHNAIGIYISNSEKTWVERCYANTNGIGVLVENSSNIGIYRCAMYNNNDNQGGVFIENSHHIVVVDCHVYHNGFGVKIGGSKSLWLNRCNVTWNTHFGIYLSDSSEDITISECNVSYNFRYGIYISEKSVASIHFNNIYNNRLYGIYCEDSSLNAQCNWWGSLLGPSRYEIGIGDRVSHEGKNTRYRPWLKHPVPNAGSTWKLDPFYHINISVENRKVIPVNGNDSDGDSIPDWWEEKYGYNPEVWDDHRYLDPDNDALSNIEEYYMYEFGADPFHRDIFLEFDWIGLKDGDDTNKLPSRYVNKLVNVFKKHNITLHIDVGNLGGGEGIVKKQPLTYSDIVDIYWDYFLHNDIDNPRKGIFHYGLVCYYGPGPGFAFIGLDNLDSFLIASEMQKEKHKLLSRQRLIAGGSIHELGHTMGLTVDDHDGIDNRGATVIPSLEFMKYKNYKSCLNYLYTYIIIDYSDGTHGRNDFDDWSNLDFYFFKNTHFEWPKTD